MIDRVIIICAGRAERWGGYMGVPKHLVTVEGEILLDRTVRQVKSRTSAPISIVAFDSRYDRAGCERFEPAHGPVRFTDVDKFLSSEPRWGDAGQTVILYGDVYFTDAAMDTILGHTGTHRFFGRAEGSYYTGCPHREMFAVSFAFSDRAHLTEQMICLRGELLAGTREKGGGWELYHYLHGKKWDHFTFIDDFTEDFDWPADYERWTRRFGSRTHRLLVPVYAPVLKAWKWRLFRWSRRLRDWRGSSVQQLRERERQEIRV